MMKIVPLLNASFVKICTINDVLKFIAVQRIGIFKARII